MKRIIQKFKSTLHASRFTLHEGGFTLLESIIAIAIFTVGISTAIKVITSAVNVGAKTKDKIIAAQLSQEGIEVVRSIRDNNWLVGNLWTTGIASGCVQWDSTSVAACSPGPRLFFNQYYLPTWSGGTVIPSYILTNAPAQFSRTIGVNVLSQDEIRVTATTTCGINCSVTLSEYLYDWK